MEAKKRIHHKLKKHAPRELHKAKKIFHFKLPKLFLLALFIIIAYLLFKQPFVYDLMSNLGKLSYPGIFIAGILISVGFSAPIGLGILITMNPESIILASFIGGLGAMVTDLLIFALIKSSLTKEFRTLEKTKLIRKIESIVAKEKNILIRHYILYVFVGIVIATPLPDEIGVSILAGLTTIKPSKLAIISFFLHSLMFFIILYGKTII